MPAPETHDYFAELYVAGKLADAGWNIYFPHRDKGFDFVIAKSVGDKMIFRPVQVKGKYPTGAKQNSGQYGYSGRLTAWHPEMVLAMPFFAVGNTTAPTCTAFIPPSKIVKQPNQYRCHPAQFVSGSPIPRRDFRVFFDTAGIAALESDTWK